MEQQHDLLLLCCLLSPAAAGCWGCAGLLCLTYTAEEDWLPKPKSSGNQQAPRMRSNHPAAADFALPFFDWSPYIWFGYPKKSVFFGACWLLVLILSSFQQSKHQVALCREKNYKEKKNWSQEWSGFFFRLVDVDDINCHANFLLLHYWMFDSKNNLKL